MAWDRPSLATLIKRNQADVESEIQGVDAKVRRRNLNILAKCVSLLSHTLYGFIAFIARQLFPATSEGEYLDRHANFWLKGGRKGASFATGFVVFSGSAGALIDEDTVLIRSDGIEYFLDELGTFIGPNLTLPVTAAVAGQAGNTEAGTTLSLSQPLDGVTSAALVGADGISGGADVEDDDRVNGRITKRVQNPPHGGARHDYEIWAEEIPGVTRSWCYGQELGDGYVTVRFVRDDDESIIPDAGEVDTVKNHIISKAPVTAKIEVFAPIPDALDFTINLTPNTQAVRDAVLAQLNDLIKRESVPGGKLLISHIREAISLAAGEQNYVMTIPNADIERTVGRMTVMGAITWG
jgi:uncharacterized phage protein gp47/JayE